MAQQSENKQLNILEVLTSLIAALGDVTLSEAVEWATVEDNARNLRKEGETEAE